MITQPGKEIIWGEMNVGARQFFADAGFGGQPSYGPSGGDTDRFRPGDRQGLTGLPDAQETDTR